MEASDEAKERTNTSRLLKLVCYILQELHLFSKSGHNSEHCSWQKVWFNISIKDKVDAFPSTKCLHAKSSPTILKEQKDVWGDSTTNCCSYSEGSISPMQTNGAVHTKSTRHGESEWSIKTYDDKKKKKAVDQDIGQWLGTFRLIH